MSTSQTGSVPMPSVQSVIAGLHADGEIVTLTGIANSPQMTKTGHGDEWGTFNLIDGGTSVKMHVFPKVYAEAGDQLNPVRESDGSLRPSMVQVTAQVDHREAQPALIAQAIVRLSSGVPVAVRPLTAEQFALIREAADRPRQPLESLLPEDGTNLDEAIASLRGEGGAR